MFKLFWVKNDKDELEMSEEIELEYWDEEEVIEEDMWQVIIDVLESGSEIIIIAPIAWVDLNDIEITLEKTIMTIKWNRKKPEVYNIEDVEIRNSECYYWKFVRNIILPENMALNKTKATMENNMLIIRIPKLKFNTTSIKIDRIEW